MRSFFLCALGLAASAAAAPDGAALYQQHCSMCHGVEGLGIAGVFPPLAKSDYLVNFREKALKAPMEGLFGQIVVNGVTYNGGMPPVFLGDEEIAAVFQHVFTSWGNEVKPATLEEVTATRAKSKFPTLAALTASMGGGGLPAAPEGWTLAPGAELSFSPTRLALHPDGQRILVLGMMGDIWTWKPGSTEVTKLIAPGDYLDLSLGEQLVMGITFDRKGRLYLTSNQRNLAKSPVANEVVIFRTEPWTGGPPPAVKPWLHIAYPFGVGPYNHGVSHIAQGPDGLLYVNSGSRTDGGEPGTRPNYATTGEDPLTATLWRIDPEAAKPEIEVYAKGLRNNYGFAWDDAGHLLASENGPDAHAPEELNFIEKGRHYGFPFQFADWTEKAYPHTPEMPAGLEITRPFKNAGPDGGKGLATYDAHSCPSGMVWLEKDWPAPLGGSFVVTRFGNLIKLDQDSGFDVVRVRPDFAKHEAAVDRIVGPLGRPIDVIKLPGHRLLIAEHSRATTFAAGMGTPGRLLLMEPKR